MFQGGWQQYRVCNHEGGSTLRSGIVQGVNLLEDAAASHNIVDDDRADPGDFTDNVGRFSDADTRPPFVHYHQWQIEELRIASRQAGSAHVRTDDGRVFPFFLTKIVRQNRQRRKWINRDIEKPLDRPGMDVYKDYPMRSHHLQHIGL